MQILLLLLFFFFWATAWTGPPRILGKIADVLFAIACFLELRGKAGLELTISQFLNRYIKLAAFFPTTMLYKKIDLYFHL